MYYGQRGQSLWESRDVFPAHISRDMARDFRLAVCLCADSAIISRHKIVCSTSYVDLSVDERRAPAERCDDLQPHLYRSLPVLFDVPVFSRLNFTGTEFVSSSRLN